MDAGTLRVAGAHSTRFAVASSPQPWLSEAPSGPSPYPSASQTKTKPKQKRERKNERRKKKRNEHRRRVRGEGGVLVRVTRHMTRRGHGSACDNTHESTLVVIGWGHTHLLVLHHLHRSERTLAQHGHDFEVVQRLHRDVGRHSRRLLPTGARGRRARTWTGRRGAHVKLHQLCVKRNTRDNTRDPMHMRSS